MSYNPQNPNGQATAANSTPVVVASDQSAIAHNLTEVNGNAVATAASGIPKVGVSDGSGNAITSTASALDVNIKSGGTTSATATDESGWTAGTNSFTPVGGVYNDTAAALTSGQEGTARLTNNRAVHTNLRNTAGTELATAGAPLRIDPVGTTTQPVSGTVNINALPTGSNTVGGVELVDSGGTNKASISAAGAVKVDGSAATQPVSGTVTANVGTTNGLALDTTVNGILVSQGSTTSGEKGPLSQGAVTTAAPTYTTAQTSPLSLDTSGNLRTSVNNTVAVSGTVSISALPTGSNTIGGVELVDSAGTNKASVSAAGAVRVDGSAATQPVSGTVTANVGTTNGLALDTSVSGLVVAQASTTSGEKGPLAQGAVTTAAPTYTTAQTSPLSLDTSGNLRTAINNTVTVSGTVTTTPPTNASTNIVQVGGSSITLGQATMASSLPVTIASNQAAFSDNITQFGGSNIVTGAGASGSGIPRVTVSNDSNVLTTQSGTWTVQPGNTPNTTPWLVSLSPSTTGGWSVSSQTALTNTVAAVKASAGQFGGYMFNNPNPSTVYIQIFNVASGGVTVGTTTPTYVIPLPAAASANVEFANGIAHATAISATATTTATGAAAPATSLVGFFLYK